MEEGPSRKKRGRQEKGTKQRKFLNQGDHLHQVSLAMIRRETGHMGNLARSGLFLHQCFASINI